MNSWGESIPGYLNCYVASVRNFADFKGRAGRKEFFVFMVMNLIFSLLLGYLERFAEITPPGSQGILSRIFEIVMILPTLSLSVRRLHDSGHDWWWLLIPMVNFFLMIREGNRGENQYGKPSAC